MRDTAPIGGLPLATVNIQNLKLTLHTTKNEMAHWPQVQKQKLVPLTY